MSQDLSYEAPDTVFFITTRTINSRLWFIRNRRLTRKILAFLAKYQEKYGVIIYGFVLMGNHYHLLAKFPRGNKSIFLKAFNAIIPKLTKSNVKSFEDGKIWARRARPIAVPLNKDILNYFFYLCLNPVYAGLLKNIKDYDLYSSFFDAVGGISRKFEITDLEKFNSRKRYNKKLKKADFTKTYTLTYSRLPGFEEMEQKEYEALMYKRLNKETHKVIKQREEEGKGFLGLSKLLKIKVGSKPRETKTSTRKSKRPLFLCSCEETLKACLDWYFAMLDAYKKASKRYLAGNLEVNFPPGTYKPVIPSGGTAVIG